MKKLLISSAVVLAFLATACDEATKGNDAAEVSAANVEKTTSIAFSEDRYNFESVTQGEKVKHSFKFKNTGDEELVIVSAKGSCGCTVPEWPKEPIAPGGEGEIYVVFNSEGRSGRQVKQVSLVANTEPATTVLVIEGEVVAPSPANTADEAMQTENSDN